MTASKPSTEPEDDSAAAAQMTTYLKVGVPVGTIVLALIAGFVQGTSLAILVLAGGALIAVIATFWASVRTLFGETPLSGADAYALGAPRTEEEQKHAVLRALKDLEFERSVGKISEEDYQALVTKYRTEAKRLLRLLDTEAQPQRAYVESLIEKRLRREGLLDGAATTEPQADEDSSEAAGEASAETSKPEAASAKKKRGAAAKAADRKKKAAAAAQAETAAEKPIEAPDETSAAVTEKTCASCSAVNDNDAAFCKKCGAKLSEPAKNEAQGEANAAETPENDGGSARINGATPPNPPEGAGA